MPGMTESIRKKLQAWDGQKMDYLASIYSNYAETKGLDEIIQLFSEDPGIQVATSWLLKHHIDTGGGFSPNQLEKILLHFKEISDWPGRLHILQIIPQVGLTIKQSELLEPVVGEFLYSENKFVRAAAYEAYFEIVRNIPPLQNEFRIQCEDSLEKVSASVRVKIRRILLKLSKIDQV